MFALRRKVLPVNRNSADDYLRWTWDLVLDLTSSLKSPTIVISDHVQDKFQQYVDDEEKRLERSLDKVRYYLDAKETIYGVLGPGRIEKVCSITYATFCLACLRNDHG